MSKLTRPLSDRDKALLFLYLSTVGYPPWAQHPRGQIDLMSALFDWTEERTEAALAQCAADDMAIKSSDPLDSPIITCDG